MTAPAADNTTLASRLSIETRDDAKFRNDVLVSVQHRLRTHVVVTSPGVTVTLTLSGAERISLIEALGGTVTR
jgi:hypothetical protein